MIMCFSLRCRSSLPCLKDMQANSWSMIVFWNESKGSTARPGQMLDWISRINQHLLPTCRRSCRLWGMKWTIQVMRIRAICQWTMRICHRRRAHVRKPDLDDDPPSQPPGGSAQVPVPGGEHDDSEPDAPLDPDDNGGGQPPGGGPQGPEPYVHGAACSLGSRCTGE